MSQTIRQLREENELLKQQIMAQQQILDTIMGGAEGEEDDTKYVDEDYPGPDDFNNDDNDDDNGGNDAGGGGDVPLIQQKINDAINQYGEAFTILYMTHCGHCHTLFEQLGVKNANRTAKDGFRYSERIGKKILPPNVIVMESEELPQEWMKLHGVQGFPDLKKWSKNGKSKSVKRDEFIQNMQQLSGY